jgi:hypothetical protein
VARKLRPELARARFLRAADARLLRLFGPKSAEQVHWVTINLRVFPADQGDQLAELIRTLAKRLRNALDRWSKSDAGWERFDGIVDGRFENAPTQTGDYLLHIHCLIWSDKWSRSQIGDRLRKEFAFSRAVCVTGLHDSDNRERELMAVSWYTNKTSTFGHYSVFRSALARMESSVGKRRMGFRYGSQGMHPSGSTNGSPSLSSGVSHVVHGVGNVSHRVTTVSHRASSGVCCSIQNSSGSHEQAQPGTAPSQSENGPEHFEVPLETEQRLERAAADRIDNRCQQVGMDHREPHQNEAKHIRDDQTRGQSEFVRRLRARIDHDPVFIAMRAVSRSSPDRDHSTVRQWCDAEPDA